MKNKAIKKFLCASLIAVNIFGTSLAGPIAYADDPVQTTQTEILTDSKKEGLFNELKNDWIAMSVLNKVTSVSTLIDRTIQYGRDFWQLAPRIVDFFKAKHYKGYRPFWEAKNNLVDVMSENSKEKIYGQEEAKNKMFSHVISSLYNIDKIKEEKNANKKVLGNVIYLLGPSGTGKTTMAKAVSDAILKHSDKSVFFIDPSAVDTYDTLKNQLFGVVTKKDIKNETFYGINFKDTKAPVLSHIKKYDEAIIIIDDYDKMKKLMANQKYQDQYNDENYLKEDRTADEVLKSIADTGKYYIDGNEIDCSKAIFIVTSNETKEEIKVNFGVGGDIGGGYQRLKIVEFESLDLEACKKIIKRMVDNITKELTNVNGKFKIKSIEVSEQSIDNMAQDIFKDNTSQGRLERTFYNDILALFSRNIGEENDKSFEISYTSDEDGNCVGNFTKTEK